VFGIGLFAFAPHPPPVPTHVTNPADLKAYLNRLVASGDPPGLSVVVVKGGQVVYLQAFGLADGPHGIAAAPDTVYHWWSMTKIPTAIAILQLQEQGRLSLDDPVQKYLPWFKVTYPSSDHPAITLRHLLQHSSGLPDIVPAIISWVHFDDTGRDQTALVKKFLPRYQALKFTPGQKAVYSNLNYMLLGAVIEAVSGQSYESYLTDHILHPLGMAQTGFVYSSSMAAHQAAGTLPVAHYYTPMLPFLVDTRTLIREGQGRLFWFRKFYIDVTPSTGLIGPVTDVARLMLAYLNGGKLDETTLLTPTSIAQMTRTAPIDGHGLGWFVGTNPARFYLEHPGGGPGFATIMRLYPDEGLGVAVLANGTDLNYAGLAGLLAGIRPDVWARRS
jgi:CubicO group peptidase (beta-lactamase class C family)